MQPRSPHHLRRLACAPRDTVPRTGQHAHRHPRHDLAPVFPAMKLRQIVSAHQPDKPRFRTNCLQRDDRLSRIARPRMGLKITDLDARVIHQRLCRCHPPLKRRWSVILQRIARTDQPPDLIQPEPLHRLKCDVHMTTVRRIKRSSQKADNATARCIWQPVLHKGFLAAAPRPVNRQFTIDAIT